MVYTKKILQQKMSITFGRSISRPSYLLWQIINAVSMHYVILGIVLTTLRVYGTYYTIKQKQSGVASKAALPRPIHNISDTELHENQTDAANTWSACFRVPLVLLFDAPVTVSVGKNNVVEGNALQFFCMHVFTALILAYPLSILLQRRKVVLDFILTSYGLYTVSTCVALKCFLPASFHWWFTVVFSTYVCYSYTWYLCRARELQTVPLGDAANNNSLDLHAESNTDYVNPISTQHLRTVSPPEQDLNSVEMEMLHTFPDNTTNTGHAKTSLTTSVSSSLASKQKTK